MRGAPPVIRPPNAAADHQFVGTQLYYDLDRIDIQQDTCTAVPFRIMSVETRPFPLKPNTVTADLQQLEVVTERLRIQV